MKPPLKSYAQANKLYMYYPRNSIYEYKVIFETDVKEVFECFVMMATKSSEDLLIGIIV